MRYRHLSPLGNFKLDITTVVANQNTQAFNFGSGAAVAEAEQIISVR